MNSVTPKTDKLSIYEFGEKLIETQDLDPVYVILYHSNWPIDKMQKWLLAYWCFYHVGTACWIVDHKDYWLAMRTAAGSKEYPRTTNRRHFRGTNAMNSVAYLESRGVDDLFKWFTYCRNFGLAPPAKDVMQHVQEWVGFGPYVSFKVADMLERVGICKVTFSGVSEYLYSSPQEGARRLWKQEFGFESPTQADADNHAYVALSDHLQSTLNCKLAPPSYNRYINIQEIETILCGWNSYMKGYYELGKDTQAIREGMLKFARCKSAQQLIAAGKATDLWN